ncbi:MAG TPA: YdeI/OmpD-associated family protein [Saprospiraceae bacterium]|nr:YdeI/OmpD-associated family protein [Saprospiraceae bacterium]HRK83849.1 YdeI/OmpD-associated family protein [Saprospiraceae bacterium]
MEAVEAYISKAGKWENLMRQIHSVLLETELKEEVKWGIPSYTFNGSMVIGMAGFKNWLALWFYQGVFLSDPNALLVSGTEGKTKGQRQWRIKSEDEFDLAILQQFVNEAIENARAGKSITIEKNKQVEIPSELAQALKENAALAAIFEAMSPSHRREYAEYVAEAKQEATRLRRVEKIVPMILSKAGLNDKYKGKS